MQVRRASLVFIVFGLITLLIIGAINLASQDDSPEPVAVPQEQKTPEPSTPENLKVEEQTEEQATEPVQSTAVASTENIPSTGAEDFIVPIGIAALVLIGSAYNRSRQLVRKSLLG